MSIVAAFLVPGSPLPMLRPDNLPWGRIAAGLQRAARALAAARPDVLLVYSTQWLAVLDELWLTRPECAGVHVDENWYEFGDLPYRVRVDTELAHACVAATRRIGVQSKGVDYDGFPIDSGTIVAQHFLDAEARVPIVAAANNLYHSPEQTEQLGALAAQLAHEQGKRAAVIGIGGLSGSILRDEIDIRADRIARTEDDQWNRRVLDLIERADVAGLRAVLPQFRAEARADMGFKHFSWLLGALGGRFYGARTHAYGPVYGSGAAVVEFTL
ncbi:MAG: tRNA U-34 5-methylaminomethyl-2-thiouridine biosynthesis protein [Burkholderiales bacterium]|jgi:2-aminophenol/2-amino-5-chlorophenol 1,6-dioxygenase subunit alpha|nr:tRNA U-34 5-methylaminomethyl-2-thiouridine biosynthesis protein [Burkholderiales bacterium]